MQTEFFYDQQGDVLIVKIDKIPEGLRKMIPTNGKFVLREGEETGHAHIIDLKQFNTEVECKEDSEIIDPQVELYYDDNDQLWLRTGKDCVITHEEHNPITIDPGEYKIDTVREIDPFEEEIKYIRD